MLLEELPTNKDNYVLIGCMGGYLQKYSTKEKKIIHNFGEVTDGKIRSIIAGPKNKSFFVSDSDGYLQCFDANTNKRIYKVFIEYIGEILLTDNNKYLATTDIKNCIVHLWSTKSIRKISFREINEDKTILSQAFTPDNQFLLIGHTNGLLSILNIQCNSLKKYQLFPDSEKHGIFNSDIVSIAVTKNNEKIYICSLDSTILTMTIKKHSQPMYNYSKGIESTLTRYTFKKDQKFENMIEYPSLRICLANDDQKLIIASQFRLKIIDCSNGLSMSNFEEFRFNSPIEGIRLINNNKSMLIAEMEGQLTIVDLTNMEREYQKIIVGKQKISKIAVI